MLRIVDKQPNRAHFALRKMEESGKLSAIITQNIDNLHRKAGSQTVWELHGNGTRWLCAIHCGMSYTYDEAAKMLDAEEKPMCQCGMATIRPDVVMFDECLNDKIYDAAYYAAKRCNLMIAMGSSLLVQPAASLLDEIPSHAKLVIINQSDTPFDKRADLVIRESCGQILEEAINE
jgi:NAD-dependent deacetylase